MINSSKAITAFRGLVGFENPADPSFAIVDNDNETASSNLYYTDNPFIKIPFLMDTQDYKDITYKEFNNYLQKINDRAVNDLLYKVYDWPDYIDRTPLFRYPHNKVDTETLPDGFVGYRIEVSRKNNIALEISRILLEFKNAGTFTLYLFNTSQLEAVKSKEITVTATLHEEALGWVLDNTDSYYKGDYYLGYFTDGFSLEPYERDYENSNILSDINGLRITRANFLTMTSTLIDTDNEESSDLSFGLNPDITTYRDYTDQSIQNKRLFAKGLQLQGQVNILANYVATMRVNQNQRITQNLINMATVELEGRDAEGVTKVGLKDKLKGQVNHIKKELDRLSENYLPKGLMTRISV